MSVKLKHLKAALDKMSAQELEQTLGVNRDDIGVSGVVLKIRKARADLLFTGESSAQPEANLVVKRQLSKSQPPPGI